MSGLRRKTNRSVLWQPISAKRYVRASVQAQPSQQEGVQVSLTARDSSIQHALVNTAQNQRLRDYEVKTKASFDAIEPVLKRLVAQQYQENLVEMAQTLVGKELGIRLPEHWLKGAWTRQLDVASLYAFCVFEQFKKMSRGFFEQDPLQGQDDNEVMTRFLKLGFHAVGIAPCADGRLAHVTSYVLRLPYGLVRRKAHAGALFDIGESVRNWVFVEHRRFCQGEPNSAAQPTRYLKIAVYHFSSHDPHHQGCAAHGSDDYAAASAAQERLDSFKLAIENRFGCEATVDTLLMGVDTDNDRLRIHVPNHVGEHDLASFIDTGKLYDMTLGMDATHARQVIRQQVSQVNVDHGRTAPVAGMVELLCWLIENNFSQIEYVKQYEKGRYLDIGHAERFIGLGNGFEEVQLRNLTYYSFLDTLEEGAADVDIGIKIFTGLNVNKGLPIPVVIRCDYDARVPGSRQRAEQKALRLQSAVHQRYATLSQQNKLATLCTLRDNSGYHASEQIATSLNLEEAKGH